MSISIHRRRSVRRLRETRGSAMCGFVLANVSPGKEPEFFSNLGSIQQVRNVFYLFDEYEYLLEVEAETPEELTKVMTNHIRHLPGVERTAPFIEGTGMGLPRPCRPGSTDKVGR